MSLEKNLQGIIDAAENGGGMDIILVSTTSEDEENFWQDRLEKGCGQICREDAKVIVVYEDWVGGAGNGLGTLYAIAKAELKAKERYGIDLLKELNDGAAVGLYHTAGKGTRLAPLPGSEGNNKPAVKLPGMIKIDDVPKPITILEAVIRQTAVYAASRKGRVSVFWGDQVFIPSTSVSYDALHHIDILAQLGPMSSAAEWQEKGLDKYGLIAVGGNGDASQVEKVSHETATKLIADGVMKVDGGIGVSLGSFSVSAAMTSALLTEYATELSEKAVKLDTDPHFWMPLTLDRETYLAMMAQKGVAEAEADAHYERMQDFLDAFLERNVGARIFGCVDVGTDCYWWDYGTIPDYVGNMLKLIGDSAESDAMRKFFGLTERQSGNFLAHDVVIDDNSIVIGCNLKGGEISNSVLVGVVADRVDTDSSVMINVAALDIAGDELLLYNVAEELSLQPDEGTVRADAFVPGVGHLPMWSNQSRDGKDDWDERLEGNGLSYGELHKANQTAKAAEATALSKEAFKKVYTKLGN